MTADGLPDISIARGAQILAGPGIDGGSCCSPFCAIETVNQAVIPSAFKIQSETDSSIHVDEKSSVPDPEVIS